METNIHITLNMTKEEAIKLQSLIEGFSSTMRITREDGVLTRRCGLVLTDEDSDFLYFFNEALKKGLEIS